jgi:predicted HD phosphohydrolase
MIRRTATTSAGETPSRSITPGLRAPAVFGSSIGVLCCFQRVAQYAQLHVAPSSAEAKSFYSDTSASKSRVLVGSSLTPGPIVEATVIDLMYLPFAEAGLTRRISSSTAE